jgi:hypothetical protein
MKKLTVVIVERLSIIQTTYKILSNIPHSKLTLYVDEIIEDRQCGFLRNRPTIGQKILCPSHTGEKCECNGTVHHLHIVYSILIQFGKSMKLVRITKMDLDETYNQVRIGKILSDTSPTYNGVEDIYDYCFFNFSSEYAIRKVQENQEWLK